MLYSHLISGSSPRLNHGGADHLAFVVVSLPFHNISNELSAFRRVQSAHL
jgi:hypothetical protein